MPYGDITINDPNPVKRWIHRRRFRDALGILESRRSNRAVEILDFGGGDGELLRQFLQSRIEVHATLFEPTPSLRREAEEKLARWPQVKITGDSWTLPAAGFDFVYCLEVFEHLPEAPTRDALASIRRLLKPEGIAVISVPHELFAPALMKGVFRMTRRYGQFDATPAHVAAAVVGRPPRNRPTTDIASGFSYHQYHLGFDYRELEKKFAPGFHVELRWFSPARALGPVLNSEVYYLLRPEPIQE
jgi:2-polyprenyl-3-methyl-5-hydroxy-6-metoxy-1,4-benzoquinol methylase